MEEQIPKNLLIGIKTIERKKNTWKSKENKTP